MLVQGVYLLPDGRFYTSAAHTEGDIEQTLESARQVFRRWAPSH
jgi:glutamate-1-semialdehyde aminotransferase